MLIVTGSVRARPENIERALALSLEHVRRSRREPGCVLHSVHRDVEEPLRIVFFEQWADADALRAIESMLARVYGKPKETVELGPSREPETVEALRALTREERHALLQDLQDQGRLRLVAPHDVD